MNTYCKQYVDYACVYLLVWFCGVYLNTVHFYWRPPF